MKVLVVGANGQLGARCCALLVEAGHDVRGSVREPARGEALRAVGVETVVADLTDTASIRVAATGAELAILSANAVVPRAGDRPAVVEEGLRRAPAVLAGQGVRRIVVPSVPVTDVDEAVPFTRARRRLENDLAGLRVETVCVRFPPFMDVHLALVGSSIPLRGAQNATVDRPSPFLRSFRNGTGTLVESRGLMLVPGPRSHRNAFITVTDAARAVVEAATRDEVEGLPHATLEVAGPQPLSWDDVAATYGRLLGRRVRVLSTPAVVYAAAQKVLRPFAEVPSNTMALNRYGASSETAWTNVGGGLLDPASMTTVEEFLREKVRLPAA